MYHKFTEQNYPDLNVVVRGLPQKYCIQGYICHVIFAGLYLPLLCPFTLAKNFDLSLYCPDKADTNTVIQKLF